MRGVMMIERGGSETGDPFVDGLCGVFTLREIGDMLEA